MEAIANKRWKPEGEVETRYRRARQEWDRRMGSAVVQARNWRLATLLWIPDSKTLAGRRKLQVPDFLQPYLVSLAKGRESQAGLFGEHWRDWPRKWVQRICKAAGVPQVTAHAMRGLHSTLAVDSGITSHAVAAALGHESFKTTAESYAQRDAVASAQQKRVLGVLSGGRKLAS